MGKRAREAVVAAAATGLAQDPGQGPAHAGGPVGLVLAPGPAQSLVTGRGGLQKRIARGLAPGLEPEGPGAAAAHKDDARPDPDDKFPGHMTLLGGLDSLFFHQP